MRLVDLLSSIYLTSALITAFVHCAKPLIENFWTLLLLTWESFHYNRTLPLKAAFLYDPTISGVYELSFIGICLATYNSALMSVSVVSRQKSKKTRIYFAGRTRFNLFGILSELGRSLRYFARIF